MSTKGTVTFEDASGTPRACIYLHNAGHDVAADLNEFFRRVQAATCGLEVRQTRFHDPAYLAARYVAWLTGGSLRSSSAGVVIPGQVHANRRFTVHCPAEPTGTPPQVEEL